MDIITRPHHLILKTDSVIFKLHKNIYLDTAHTFYRVFEISFHPSHLFIKTFLVFTRCDNVQHLPSITNPERESWFFENIIMREFLDFFFEF
jgi:hypothetical protein